MPTPQERLAEARRRLAAGDLRKASRSAWRELIDAVAAADSGVFAECKEFAAELLAVATTDKQREEARQLARYADACLNGATGRPQTLIDRLLGRQPPVRTRKCPDCAESIQLDAKVCRFCGLRLDD